MNRTIEKTSVHWIWPVVYWMTRHLEGIQMEIWWQRNLGKRYVDRPVWMGKMCEDICSMGMFNEWWLQQRIILMIKWIGWPILKSTTLSPNMAPFPRVISRPPVAGWLHGTPSIMGGTVFCPYWNRHPGCRLAFPVCNASANTISCGLSESTIMASHRAVLLTK